MRTMIAALVAACLLATMPALAADDEGGGGGGAVKTEKGFYAGLGGMVALDAYDVPTGVSGEAGWGLDTRVGYRVFSWLAGELQYQYVPHQQITVSGVGRTDFTTNALTANGKVYILNGPIQPYVLLGFGFQDVNASGGGVNASSLQTALRVGGGAQFMFTEHIGAYGEITYLQPFSSLRDYATVPIALGALYQF